MIEHLVNEIERCLKNDLQIAALTMALTLPDTCGKVYHPQASVSNRYTSWYDDHVLAPKSELIGDTSKRFWVSGNVVYKLRCAMLHESNPTVVGTEENIAHFSLIWRPASSCSRVPIERCIELDENGAPHQQAISIDIVSLCQDICEAALLYYRKNKEYFSFNYRIISTSDRLANLFGYDNEINI
jgi:hypothetical protein